MFLLTGTTKGESTVPSEWNKLSIKLKGLNRTPALPMERTEGPYLHRKKEPRLSTMNFCVCFSAFPLPLNFQCHKRLHGRTVLWQRVLWRNILKFYSEPSFKLVGKRWIAPQTILSPNNWQKNLICTFTCFGKFYSNEPNNLNSQTWSHEDTPTPSAPTLAPTMLLVSNTSTLSVPSSPPTVPASPSIWLTNRTWSQDLANLSC